MGRKAFPEFYFQRNRKNFHRVEIEIFVVVWEKSK